MKKMIRLFLSMMLFFACSLLTTGCSCTPGYAVKVTFLEIPEEFNVENYIRECEFEEDVYIEFKVPKGYDESVITITANGTNIDYDVEYLDAEGVDNDHLYSVEKKISFTILKVNKTINVVVDLTEVEKETFEISLANNINIPDCFRLITLKDDLDDNLLSLNAEQVVNDTNFHDRKTQVYYGDEVALIYLQRTNNPKYESVYVDADPVYFKNLEDVKTINNINYMQYDVSKRGHNYYRYNYDASSKIFYFGEVKEDIKFHVNIPNYVNENKLNVGDGFNTFYLLTNMEKYNSDILSIEAYIPNSKVSYSVSNPLVDRINGTVISKISGEEYKQRYDLYNMYVGDNLANDLLLEDEEKINLYSTIYFKIKSEVDFSNLDMRLLKAEKEHDEGYYPLQANIVSDKDNYYIKISKEEASLFCDQYVYEDEYGNTTTYLNGSAALYVEMDYEYIKASKKKGTFEYTRLVLQLNILNDNAENFEGKLHLIPYIKEDDSVDYGSMDYHFYGNDVVYLRTDKLFDEDDESLNNLYVDIFSEDYKDYQTTKISMINIIVDHETITKEPLIVMNPKQYNGYKGHILPLVERDQLDEYRIVIDVLFRDVEKKDYKIDFSNLELPKISSDQGYDRIYVTNSFMITNYSDFDTITYINEDSYEKVSFSYSNELYFVIVSPNNPNFNFDLYLDSDDRNTLVTTEGVLKDIRGKVIKVVIDGREYEVRYKYMSVTYEVPQNQKYSALPA